MFKRTNAGLSIEKKFYNVDYILYCEGETENEEDLSTDELYWEAIFKKFNMDVKCKSVGSKNSLNEYIKLIRNKNEGILVSTDRDYDDFYNYYGPFENNPKIIQSFGYSFESDIIYLLSPEEVGHLFAAKRNDKFYEEEMLKFLKKIEKDIKRASIIDVKYIKYSKSLFNRKSPQSIIGSTKKSKPSLNKKAFVENILKLKREISKNPPHIVSHPNFPPYYIGSQVFFGKTVSHMIWLFFQFFSKKNKIPYDTFIKHAISTIKRSNVNNNVYQYYRKKISHLQNKSTT